MAKSARASSKKAARARIRNTVYAPVENARLERLSARLLASIAQSTTPRTPNADQMEEDALGDAANRQEQHTEDQAFKTAPKDSNASTTTTTNMDIDETSTSRGPTTKAAKPSHHKISKRKRKPSAKAIVFSTRKHGGAKRGAGKGSKGTRK
ncbi:hypothetical protein TWF696_005997 [Orbilia brochopaga]|uniref:DUF2423 domain-containing protein n=1 Tax=Orbilia brochopaga TaxID=3140254 RepID=A0AAV9UVG8_9PEZI